MTDQKFTAPDPQYYLSLIRLTVTCHQQPDQQTDSQEARELEQFAKSLVEH